MSGRSWVLLILFVVFLGVVWWLVRNSRREDSGEWSSTESGPLPPAGIVPEPPGAPSDPGIGLAGAGMMAPGAPAAVAGPGVVPSGESTAPRSPEAERAAGREGEIQWWEKDDAAGAGRGDGSLEPIVVAEPGATRSGEASPADDRGEVAAADDGAATLERADLATKDADVPPSGAPADHTTDADMASSEGAVDVAPGPDDHRDRAVDRGDQVGFAAPAERSGVVADDNADALGGEDEGADAPEASAERPEQVTGEASADRPEQVTAEEQVVAHRDGVEGTSPGAFDVPEAGTVVSDGDLLEGHLDVGVPVERAEPPVGTPGAGLSGASAAAAAARVGARAPHAVEEDGAAHGAEANQRAILAQGGRVDAIADAEGLGAPDWHRIGDEPSAESAGQPSARPLFGEADDAERAAWDFEPQDEAGSHDHAVWDGGWGVGSAAPNDDGCMPIGHPIKGVFAFGHLYQVPGSDWYAATVADVWFTDEATAQRAGFRRGEG